MVKCVSEYSGRVVCVIELGIGIYITALCVQAVVILSASFLHQPYTCIPLHFLVPSFLCPVVIVEAILCCRSHACTKNNLTVYFSLCVSVQLVY